MRHVDEAYGFHGRVHKLAAAAIFLLFSPQVFAQYLASPYWQSQTNGMSTGPHATQEAAADAWVAATNGAWRRNGPCEPVGTTRYRFCPLLHFTGGRGAMDVPLLCPNSATSASVSPDGLGCPLFFASVEPPPLGERCCDNPQGDPINPATGNVYLTEPDVVIASGDGTLQFVRYYNSADDLDTGLGKGWRGSFSRVVVANSSRAPVRP
jgi:hypothetical protein